MDETPTKPDQPTTVKSPRRHWHQFTLRTLLIFVTLAGCGFGWLGFKIREARQEAAAVAAIEKAGGFVFYSFQWEPFNFIYAPDAAPPGPKWLRAILGDHFFTSVWGWCFVTMKAGPLRTPTWKLLRGCRNSKGWRLSIPQG
jgi:hypothetical protein